MSDPSSSPKKGPQQLMPAPAPLPTHTSRNTTNVDIVSPVRDPSHSLDHQSPVQRTPHHHQSSQPGANEGDRNIAPDANRTDHPSSNESPEGRPHSQGSSQDIPKATPPKYSPYHADSASQSSDVLSISNVVEVEEEHSRSYDTTRSSNKTSDSIATISSGSTKGSARSNPSSSDLSYTNAQTSTPNATTTPRSTPSDSDRFSIPSQVSPSTRAGLRGGSQGSQGNSQVRGPSQSAGWNSSSGSGSGDSSGNLGVPTILEVDESTDILDQATLPIVGTDYGTDISQYDDEKSLGEGEKLQEQVLTAEVLAALNGNKGSSKRSGVQDVPQPSASTSKKRTAHRSSAVSAVTQDSNRSPASYSSDEDGEASRTSSGRVIKLEFSQSQSQADSSSLSRSRTAPGTAAASFSASTQTDNIPSTATLGSSVGTDPRRESESSMRAVPETQDIPGPSGPTTPPRRDRTSAQRSSRSRMKGSQANIPPSRRYSRSSPDDGNIGDASNSQDSSLSPSTNSSFLQKLKEVVPAEDLPENLLKKRRRHTVKDSNPFQADPYVDEGEITDSHEQSEDRPFTRSRSASQDISYFPHDSSEFDESSAYESTSIAEEPSSLPSTSQRQRSISPEASSKPRTSRSRELRKRQSSQNSSPSSSTRPTLRRMRSATDQLRVYKQDDCVMARWEREDYYAGVVQNRQQERYQIHFLDDTRLSVFSEFIRPLKLKLGTEVLGIKADGGQCPAIIEGVHMAPEVDQSRVDVRFDDGTMGNLSLDKISLVQATIDKLDNTIDWTKVEVRSAHPPKTTDTLEIPPIQSGSVSAPSTPRKNNARMQPSGRVSSGSLTPSRRGQVDAGLLSPSRRGKDLFKQLTFVLSLTGPGGSSELLTTTVRKITKEGGTVADDFSTVVENGVLRPNVILITVSAIRTNKYIEALAWNIPRLTYRWVDACVQHRQLLPYQSFLLPTGFSTELDTVISSTPLDDRGVFDGLTIGLYASQALLAVWSRILKAAGATVVTINSRAGDMGCNYIVFSSIARHKTYCVKNVAVPSLATEWVTQCLINQRVLPIHGHPSYTTILPPVQKAA